MTARIVAPCGCPILPDHTNGERAMSCPGGGLSIPAGSRLIDREQLAECPGGVLYAVAARPSVVYEIRPFNEGSAA